MSKPLMTRRVVMVAIGMALGITVGASAGGVPFWVAFLRGDVAPALDASASLRLVGGDGASIPPATAQEQGLDPGALEAAGATARRLGASAFAVARRGHAVYVWSGGGEEARVRSALLSRLVTGAGEAALGDATGLARWSLEQRGEGSLRNPWSTRSRSRYGVVPPPPAMDAAAWSARVSLELWRPLAARDALVERDPNGTLRLHCCIWLRPRDALALASALVNGGEVDGQRLMDAAAAARVLQQLDDGIAPRGPEPFGARPARLWRDHEGTRLYFFPVQELTILLVRADEAALSDETGIAHQVLRGIVDRAATPAAAPGPRELVPGH